MVTETKQVVREQKQISRAFRAKVKSDPEYAKQFLLDAGILVRKKSATNGVVLAKRFRSAG